MTARHPVSTFDLGAECQRQAELHKVHFRGTLYPDNTEVEPYVPDQVTPRDPQHINIPNWLRKVPK